MRDDPGVVSNYGKLLVEMVSVVPDGIVCFFVSYSYMDGIISNWHQHKILEVRNIGGCFASKMVVFYLHSLGACIDNLVIYATYFAENNAA